MLLTLGCKTMREGVVASFVFFLLGIGLILASIHILPHIWNLQHIVMFSGFVLVLLSPIILLSTFLITVLPSSKKKLDQCDH